MTVIRFYSAAVLALVVSSASAHEGMHGPGAEFDANEDGKLSVAEYTAYLQSSKQDVAAAAEKFAKLDRDKDGFLTSSEFILGLPKAPAANNNQ
ncbi:hypothetical protein HNQ60_003885 [Povalibacter uvarum]|uniref:EF-hand domain-containing protein n=1 Tax=Povalibacter uvarum TaxID=732238 RepID=A0A841HSJ4_9GAMM|nr:EF-hand domain-containing protein [Povalibacter uvarum]MBB6094998.1 hypothetical protein [Povalibacter uvarum]